MAWVACFVLLLPTDAELRPNFERIWYREFPQGSRDRTQTVCAYFRRWLRVLLCFISTDAEGIFWHRGFPQGSPPRHPNCLRLLPSLATPGPPSSLQTRTTPEIPILLFEVQSGVLHLFGLIRGGAPKSPKIPIPSSVVEMDRLPARRLRLSKSCLSSPVPARWPALRT